MMINAPMAAFRAVYKEDPATPLTGRTIFSKRKIWNGLDVDYHLKDKWLEALNRLPIEVRSTEEGKGPSRPAHVAFRMKESSKDGDVPIMVKSLEMMGYSVYTDVGLGNRPRIVVAATVSPEDGEKWEAWWENLPFSILKAYDNTKLF